MGAVNEVLERYSGLKEKLLMDLHVAEEGGIRMDYLLIEGGSTRLRFVGELLIAIAKADECDVFLHPQGPGMAHFSTASRIGLIVHRLPCEQGSMSKTNDSN